MDLSKVLITGGTGIVGREVNFGTKPPRSELDILKPDTIKHVLKRYQPTAVLHLAALVDMGVCEEHPEQAYETNVVGTFNIATVCRSNNIKFIYVSTCAVFNGNKEMPYRETDLPQPINVYGRTKWLGEIIARDLLSNSLIIRTGWLFGSTMPERKFVRICFEKLSHGENVVATKDRIGSPTYIKDFLAALRNLLTQDAFGIVHVVNDGIASYYDIGMKIKELGGFASAVNPTLSGLVESSTVKRGKMEGLVSQSIRLRPWTEALKDYIAAKLIE